MTYEQFRQIHRIQLLIMDDIHRVCVDYGLKYYMIGGTALGAVRHGGFIPWDPDIDIAMPRDDYEKFVTIYSKELKTELSCHDYRTDRRHYCPHALVSYNKSKLIFKNLDKSPFLTFGDYGIYVDILPLDKVPNNITLRKKHEKRLSIIKNLRYYKMCRICASNSWLVIQAKVLLSLIIPISLYRISLWQQKIAQEYNYLPQEEATDICSTLSHYRYEKLCMPQSIWGAPTLYDFEGRQYYGPKDIKSYLKKLFGNYMELPSEEHRSISLKNIIYAEWIDSDGKKIVLK